MAKVRFTESAKNDIRKIADFTFEQFGAQQFEIYQLKLFKGFDDLLRFSGLDRTYKGSKVECLHVRIERHMVFFSRQGDGDILIRRVLGAQVDFKRHL